MKEHGKGNYGFQVIVPGKPVETYWYEKSSVRDSNFHNKASQIGRMSRIKKVDRKPKK